jgi:hypothetical protein
VCAKRFFTASRSGLMIENGTGASDCGRGNLWSSLMRTNRRIASVAVIVFVAALAFSGCGGNSSGSGSSSPPATGVVTVYPGTATVPADATAQVQFSAFQPSQPTATFTWSVNGGASNGSIDASTGLYTPPTSVPSPATVSITAANSAATNESGTATITIVAVQGVTVSPAALAVPAGTTATFSATASGSPVTPTWEVNGVAGGNATVGTIATNSQGQGVYTAPLTPPAGGGVTITAVSGANNGTATATIVFSDNSLSGQYAFSYAGSDASSSSVISTGTPPVLAVAGSFTANPTTGAISGIEDYNSDGSPTVALALPVSGTYQVNPDGSGSAVLNNPATLAGTEILQFTLTAGTAGGVSRHALVVRFDNTAAGSGSIDLQNTAELNNLASVSGNYVFGISGIDSSGFPIQFAGIFKADGAGNIPLTYGEQDINDFGNATRLAAPDLSLHGTYSLDTSNPGSGRGYITLTNSSAQYPCNCQLAFYMVDSTHLKIVEIARSGAELLAGDLYAAPNTARGSYSLNSFNGHYSFTLGGADLNGNPYAQGGILIADGLGGITGGIVDTNDNGSRQLNVSVARGSYTVDSTLGRLSIPLVYGSTSTNFTAYAASNGSVEIISLDSNFMDSGLGFSQTSTASPLGSFALNLTGVVISSGSEEDVAGQITVPSSAPPTGNLAINNSGNLVVGTPLGSASTVGSADPNGRGTASVASYLATYPLIYYTIDDNNVLLFESDSSRTMVGTLSRQF